MGLTFEQGKLSGPSILHDPALPLLHLLSVLCRKAKAIELMLVDALLAAEPVLKMTERIHDPREFLQMDDTILKQVEHYGMLHPEFESSDEYAPVAASQKIISRYAQEQQQQPDSRDLFCVCLHEYSHTYDPPCCLICAPNKLFYALFPLLNPP